MDPLPQFQSLADDILNDYKKLPQITARYRRTQTPFALEPIERRSVVGVPWLAELPIIGTFFRTTTSQMLQRTLIATVRALREREGAVAFSSVIEQRLEEADPEETPASAAGG